MTTKLHRITTTILLLFMISCAAFRKDNTPLISAVEDNLVPESQPAKTLTAPFYLTAGVVGGIIDVFVIHPVSEIPESYHDTKDALFDIEAGYYTDWGSFPVRLGFSPVFFSLVWLARSTLYTGDDSSVEEPARFTEEQARQIEDIDKLKEFLNQCSYKANSGEDSYSLDLYIELYRKFEKKEPGMRKSFLQCMNSSNWKSSKDKATYESFLINQLGDLKLDQMIVYELESMKSVMGSKQMLELLSSQDLEKRQIQSYLNGIINIDHRPHIEELKRRLRVQ